MAPTFNVAKAVDFYRKLSTKEIRRRQRLCEAQIGLAFEQRLDGAMVELHAMQNALTAAMLERC